MRTLSELQADWEAGRLDEAGFVAQAHALHRLLAGLVPPLVKSEVHQILIDGEGLRFVMGDEAVALWCPTEDPHAAPLEALNFGAYQPDESRVINRLSEGARCAVDVGAGLGYHALRLAQREGLAIVHAFEPHAARFELLWRNLALNALVERVRCHNLALTAHTAHTSPIAHTAQTGPCQTLDAWARAGAWQPEYIRCGAPQALAVFQGAQELLGEQRPRVFTRLDGPELQAWFAALGYACWALGEYGPRRLEAGASCGSSRFGAFLHPQAHADLIEALEAEEAQ